jgi:hypothetical protein
LTSANSKYCIKITPANGPVVFTNTPDVSDGLRAFLFPCGGHGTSLDQPSKRERSWLAHLSRDRKASTAADKHSSGPEFARLWFSPHHGRGKCCKRMVVQAHRVAFSLSRKMQDAACELVSPHFFNAVAFERQPSLIERCFQDRECLGIKRSAAKSTHVPSLRHDLAGGGPS